MKKLFLLLLLVSPIAFAQTQGVRLENFSWTTNRIGGIRPVVPIPNAQVQVCNFPANAVPCTNYATTYTDISMGTQCNGFNGCSNPMTTDDNGKFGFWLAPGTYQYTYTSPLGLNFGPYTATLSITGATIVVNHNLLSTLHPDTVPYSPPAYGDWIQGDSIGKWEAQHGNSSVIPQFMRSIGNGTSPVSQGFATVGGNCPSGQFANGINNDISPACAVLPATNQTAITPPPPFPVPPGQAVAWAFPATSVYGPGTGGATNGSAYSTPNYGYVTMTSSSGLGNWTWGAQWQGFAMPTLPGDAVIQGIYGVMVASKVGDGRAACGTTKPNLYTESTGWTGANFNWHSGAALGEYYTTTLGTSTSTVTSMICAIQEFQTLGATYNPPLQVTAYSMVLAIYYTTASPPQNAQFILPVPSSYSNLLGVSATYTPLTDGNPITFDAQNNYIYNGTTTLAHTLPTRALNVANLQVGGVYNLSLVQDSVGGAITTLGSGCTWIVNNVATTSLGLSTAASSVQEISWVYDGTRCFVDTTPTGGGSMVYPSAGLAASTGSAWRAPGSSDVIGLFSGCSGTALLGADGNCHSIGTIASGTATLGTSAIASGTCSSAVTVAASGVLTTDAIQFTPNTDPTAVTGYAPSASGSLYIWPYPTANNVNFKVCNNTSGSITPSALTLNWRVSR